MRTIDDHSNWPKRPEGDICPQCEGPMPSNHGNREFCSKKCADASEKEKE